MEMANCELITFPSGTAMTFEECLDNLKHTRDYNIYLDMLNALKDKYLIILCIKDSSGNNLDDEMLKKVHSLGFTKFTRDFRVMYIGISNNGNIIMNKAGEKRDEPLSFEGKIGNVDVFAVSKSYNSGNNADILINGENYSLNGRGSNIVVADSVNGTVIDVSMFDSFADRPADKPTFYHRDLNCDAEFFKSHLYVQERYEYIWRPQFERTGFSNRKLDVKEVENGIILPNKPINGYVYGGVCDENFNYISGHNCIRVAGGTGWRHICGSYTVPNDEIEYIDEEVVYGGTLIDHPGHLIVECFADRIWWYIKNPLSKIKVAIVAIWRDGKETFPYEFLDCFGIPIERVITVKKPTKFKNIIVPEQAATPLIGASSIYEFTEEYRSVYKRMRDNVEGAGYKKVYFTKLKASQKKIVGEEYFVDFYKSRGFTIVNPEEYSVREKIQFLKDADEFAAPLGTNILYGVFCKPTAKITILTRLPDVVDECEIDVLKTVGIQNIYCVDVSYNFFHKDIIWGTSLITVTDEFKRFIEETTGEHLDICPNEYLLKGLYEYICHLPVHYSGREPFNRLKNQKMITVLQNISECFLGRKFDTSKLDLTTNEDDLLNQVKQLTADLDKSKKRISELENLDVYKTVKSLETTVPNLEGACAGFVSANASFKEQVVKLQSVLERIPDLQSKIDELSKENTALTESVEFTKRALENKEKDFRSKEEQLQNDLKSAKEINQKLAAQLEELKGKLSSESSKLKKYMQEFDARESAAKLREEQLQKQIEGYEQSRSWRITKPLRSIAWFFRGKNK